MTSMRSSTLQGAVAMTTLHTTTEGSCSRVLRAADPVPLEGQQPPYPGDYPMSPSLTFLPSALQNLLHSLYCFCVLAKTCQLISWAAGVHVSLRGLQLLERSVVRVQSYSINSFRTGSRVPRTAHPHSLHLPQTPPWDR